MKPHDVLLRMQRDDTLTVTSSYSLQSAFSDGYTVSHQAMQTMLDNRKIALDGHPARGAKWLLLPCHRVSLAPELVSLPYSSNSQ